MIIYKITNKINGKVYIGQTIKPLIIRWKRHCNPSNASCLSIHRAIMKYGKENFTIEQIDIAIDREELNKKEQYWIKYYDSMNPEKGYNLTSGGERCKVSEATRKRLRDAQLGKKASDETKKKMSEAHTGMKMSIEAIKKSVETKRKTGVYTKIAKIARLNGKKCGKKILCVELNKVYNSIIEAGLKNKLNRANISACIRGITKTCGGYHWKLK